MTINLVHQSQKDSLLKHLAGHVTLHAQLLHAVLIENDDDVVSLSKELHDSTNILVAYIRSWKHPAFEDRVPAGGWCQKTDSTSLVK